MIPYALHEPVVQDLSLLARLLLSNLLLVSGERPFPASPGLLESLLGMQGLYVGEALDELVREGLVDLSDPESGPLSGQILSGQIADVGVARIAPMLAEYLAA